MAVKSAKPKPRTLIELPPEDVPFDAVIHKLLAAPPAHEPRQAKKVRAKLKRGARKKRVRS